MAWRRHPHKPSKKRIPSLAPVPALDSNPTPERLKHSGGALAVGGDQRSAKVVRMMDSPLDRLRHEGRLSELQHTALARLHRHWMLGALSGTPRSVDLNRTASQGPGDGAGEYQTMHQDCFRHAFNILHPLERVICSATILEEQPVDQAGTMLGYTSRYRARMAAMEQLRSAADRLVWFWQLR